MQREPVTGPTAAELKAFEDPSPAAEQDARNRQLLRWLSNDQTRNQLFRHINHWRGGRLTFPSRDSAPSECACDGLETPPKPAVPGHLPVTLVTDRNQIEKILMDPKQRYSSRVYAELGGGSFMLALDPASDEAHRLQRAAFDACFRPYIAASGSCAHASGQTSTGQQTHQQQVSDAALLAPARAACSAAAVIGLRSPDFDLADYAEQAALRYCQLLMGYASQDYRLLETTLRIAYKGLVHQVFGRHFVTDRTLIPEAKLAMGRLLTRTAALIDAYAADDADELKGTKDPARQGWDPALQRLARLHSPLNGEQRAIVAVGAAIGSVGNVQAAVCIAIKALFADYETLDRARKLALTPEPRDPAGRISIWKSLIAPALHANPPIPYLPRVMVGEDGKIHQLLLALGGATQDSQAPDDPLLWGLKRPRGDAPHSCIGQPLAWPLIIEIVSTVMALPGLEQALDPEDARVKGLEKRHGFACVSYPLTHRRDRHHVQTSLNVAMRIKAPMRENADRLRNVIRTGAPRIERTLRESAHVHFAWFEFIEADTVLVLHTVYDGPFDAYLQHFALRAGDLFDQMFECLEDPPPMPVDKFPTEFVAHLLRYDRKPALGYFFSAYPGSEVARILRNELREA